MYCTLCYNKLRVTVYTVADVKNLFYAEKAMKKRILFTACLILAAALAVTVLPVMPKTELTASNPTYALGIFDVLSGGNNTGTTGADGETAASTNSLGEIVSEIGDKSNSGAGAIIGDLIGGIAGDSDIVEGFGNIVGGLFEGLGGGGNSGATQQAPVETYQINTIAPMVTMPEPTTEAPSTTEEPATEPSTEVSSEAVTYDFASGNNPFLKPSDAVASDAEGDAVKWLQWVFVYTNYGLNEADINGKLDEKTVSLIKKLQTERGLDPNGELTKETIDKAELLYFETKLGAGNTGQYIEPSVSVEQPSETGDDAAAAKSTKIRNLIIIIAAVWLVVVAGVVAFFVIKKKKLAKEVAELDEQEKPLPEDKTSDNKAAETKQGEIGGISDLFAEAENDGKKRRKDKKK